MATNKKNKPFLKVESQKKLDAISLEQWPSKPISANLPFGSFTTKIIMMNGEIIKRIYKAPNGQQIALFPNPISKVA
tara:strand:+ start:315 stop:545 length:231 start_codon:yes stop_codon:yes gene_type:complete